MLCDVCMFISEHLTYLEVCASLGIVLTYS